VLFAFKAAAVTHLLAGQTLDFSDVWYLLARGRVVTSGDTAAPKKEKELHKTPFEGA